jgi:hypothetical protein
MRILLLGSSNDRGGRFEGGQLRHEIVRDRLAAEFGEPVEVVVKPIWPNEALPGLLGRWLDQHAPDLVYLNVVSFWFTFESVPLRVERLLGRFGRPIARAGLRAAESPWLAHNPAFRALRRFAQRTIGGDTYFTAEQVVDRIGQCIHLVLQREEVVLAVKGPHGRVDYAVSTGRGRRIERRRLQVHGALATLCKQLHVYYAGSDSPVWKTRDFRRTAAGDRLHENAEGHVATADSMHRVICEAWLGARGGVARSQASGDEILV